MDAPLTRYELSHLEEWYRGEGHEPLIIPVAPEAIAVLRYFYEERPDVLVLAAGFLVEFTLLNAKFSMPVGRVE